MSLSMEWELAEGPESVAARVAAVLPAVAVPQSERLARRPACAAGRTLPAAPTDLAPLGPARQAPAARAQVRLHRLRRLTGCRRSRVS